MSGLLEKINESVGEYDSVFDFLLWKSYMFIVIPVSILQIFQHYYLPVILNHWFGYADTTKFESYDKSWWAIHAMWYDYWHPFMDMAKYFNECSTDGKWWYLLATLPGYLLLYCAIYGLIAGILYWVIWNNIIAPIIGGYISPIMKNVK